jgi:hypothetical protein
MAKIVDPSLLTKDQEVQFDTANRTIKLITTGSSVLTTDGVSLQALYSFCKEQWKDDSTLIKYPFPLVAITPEQFEFTDGWLPFDAPTVGLFRDAGFAITSGGTTREEYIGCITLGSVGSGDQIYYLQSSAGTSTNVILSGAVNQCIKIVGDGSGFGVDNAGVFSARSYFSIFDREYQRTYAKSSLGDIGVSNLTYQAYRFPLATGDDLKITHNDASADNSGVTITYSAYGISRTIGGVPHNFNVIIDGNSKPTTAIYEAVQSKLRKTTDIDAGSGVVTGKTADPLLRFVGDTLVTYPGVYIDNFRSEDTNTIEFYDTGNTKWTFPFVAAGSINFNSNLVNDGNAVYAMFFTTLPTAGDNFGQSGATYVNNNSSVPITGAVTASTVSFTFDYDGNVQGGRSSGTTADVTVVAIGLNTAQYVSQTGSITRSSTNSVSLVSSLERNYTNP